MCILRRKSSQKERKREIEKKRKVVSGVFVQSAPVVTLQTKLQALFYSILPPANVVTDYATGLGKLSANGQCFIGAQMAVSL